MVQPYSSSMWKAEAGWSQQIQNHSRLDSEFKVALNYKDSDSKTQKNNVLEEEQWHIVFNQLYSLQSVFHYLQ